MMLVTAGVATVFFYALLGVVLFGAAGTLDVPMFWAYLITQTAISLLALVILNMRSPDLIGERMRPGAGERDRVFKTVATLSFFACFAIAGLDVGRYHWSNSVPLGLQIVGLIAVSAGMGIVVWAMAVNRFFSSAVRIQADRGQRVITHGPYRFVRHPGYTGGLLFLLCGGLALGSWLSILPMLAAAALVIRRTILEDNMLQRELDGYADYARRVRYRLIPGLW